MATYNLMQAQNCFTLISPLNQINFLLGHSFVPLPLVYCGRWT